MQELGRALQVHSTGLSAQSNVLNIKHQNFHKESSGATQSYSKSFPLFLQHSLAVVRYSHLSSINISTKNKFSSCSVPSSKDNYV